MFVVVDALETVGAARCGDMASDAMRPCVDCNNGVGFREESFTWRSFNLLEIEP